MSNLIQTIIGAAFSVGFFLLLALVAWYIALPLLILGIIFFVGRALYVRYLVYKTFQNLTGTQTRPRATPKRKKEPTDNIIDVEYTEL